MLKDLFSATNCLTQQAIATRPKLKISLSLRQVNLLRHWGNLNNCSGTRIISCCLMFRNYEISNFIRLKTEQSDFFLFKLVTLDWFSISCFYPPTKSEGYSFGVVRPSIPPVRNHISVPIGQIWFILGTNDKYHGLSISYKFGQNRPLNTWVIALVLVLPLF